MDAVSDERLSDVTRSVSLLARWSPTPPGSGWPPGGATGDPEDPEVLCTDRLRSPSGPMVNGRECGVRRRTASRWSLALPPATDRDEEAVAAETGEDAAAAMAMVTVGAEVVKGGGEKRGGEEEGW